MNLNTLLEDTNLDNSLRSIGQKVLKAERITFDEGVQLFEKGDLGFLGALANHVRERKNGNQTFFNRNFHIEPTNICVFSCKFCSYSRTLKNREEGWELSAEQILQKVKDYDGKPVTEVHIVGGVHPKMDMYYFIDILKQIKAHRPDLHIKGFTAVELDYMFRKAKVSTEEGMKLMHEAGLDSLPGGGAEIFDEDIRNIICADKCSSDVWLKIHETAHNLGMHTNATMLYGHIENYTHRIDHMERLRQLQDKTKGFNTFIPLKFRNGDNEMSSTPEVTVIEDLKTYAVSRIYLDNFNHVKAYWPMIGRSTAQLSQAFGVDDLDGTIDDTTKIYSMAGAEDQNPALTTEQLVTLIKESGRQAVERDTLYNVVSIFNE
ncbi:MAG: aminofutalosine synthase MqnE [Bacteroidia bacterium]|nr:aminofutalosine synthase MqnE [Bacteroidota bacterium]MBP9789226.1 aminofutalosine synthase MqnE [Bacteroidia bacterium]MBP9923185.1 aminofutalosine synthase MqnE [Bacteroidia bacterium]